jgi:hypothetical protein
MKKATTEEFLKGTPELSPDKKYWYVRSDSGLNYETFTNNNFIAIAWNYVTVEDIKNSLGNDSSLRTKLNNKFKNSEKYKDKKESVVKGAVTSTIGKLQDFYSMKRGDIVIVPNRKTTRLSFGVIEDDGIIVNNEGLHDCSYFKRRHVHWVEHRPFHELDRAFGVFKRNMHAITNLRSDLHEPIDRVMNTVYYKGGYGHYVVRINKREDIKASDLFKLGGHLLYLMEIINEREGFNEQVDDTIVKINVQSKGDFLLKSINGNTIIALAFALSVISCSNSIDETPLDPNNPEEVEMYHDIKNRMDSAQMEILNRN